MTTNVGTMKSVYKVSIGTASLIVRWMRDGDLEHRMQMVDTPVMPINSSPYVKQILGKVFEVENAIDLCMLPEPNRWKVSEYQYKKNIAIRERAFEELNRALKEFNRERK